MRDEASRCVAVGETCLSHCLMLLAQGDTSMAECATAVSQMLAVCRAMASLAAQGSSHAKAQAVVCKTVCEECAAACRPHKDHHKECAACAEACDRTVAALAKLV